MAPRYCATPTVAKHRVLIWADGVVLLDHQLVAFARDDDYFFGVLHSAVRERRARRLGTQLREAESGCRYTPTTCFETFPFPPAADGIDKEATSPAALAVRHRITASAARLNELRENWLNPPELVREDSLEFPGSADGPWARYIQKPDARGIGTVRYPRRVARDAAAEGQLARRTLTNLYNERPTWLELAHLELDRAVLAAYGLSEEWAEALQPKRDADGKVNPILGVVDPAAEQKLLASLLELNRRGARR